MVEQSHAPNQHLRDERPSAAPPADTRRPSASESPDVASADFYSVKMRASLEGLHISGAEVLVEASQADLPTITAQLTNRALTHPKGRADSIVIHTELIPGAQIRLVPMLNVQEHHTGSVTESTHVMRELLHSTGIAPQAIEAGLELLHTVTGLRGAMLVDAHTGQRLEADQQRGVRVSMFGAQVPGDDIEMKRHHQEALLLASKVLATPYVVAEACISDDPDYTTGYLACGDTYHRIFNVKEQGANQGTRVWFVDLSADPRRLGESPGTEHARTPDRGENPSPRSAAPGSAAADVAGRMASEPIPVQSLAHVVETIQYFAEHQPVLITEALGAKSHWER